MRVNSALTRVNRSEVSTHARGGIAVIVSIVTLDGFCARRFCPPASHSLFVFSFPVGAWASHCDMCWAQAGFPPLPSHPITWVGGVDHVVVTRRSGAGPALRATLGIIFRYSGKGRSVNRVL